MASSNKKPDAQLWKDVLNGLYRLRLSGSLCDVTLKAGGEEFKAHKVVLSAASEYFETMFTGYFAEKEASEVTMEDVTATGLGTLLNFIYTGKMSLNDDLAEEVFRVSHLVNQQAAVDKCVDYLVENMGPVTCVNNIRMGRHFSMKKLKRAAWDYLDKHFSAISQTALFLTMSKEDVIRAVSSDNIGAHAACELEVFHAAERWLLHCPERQAYTLDVMSKIRYGLLSMADVAEVMKSKLMANETFREFFVENFKEISAAALLPLAKPNLVKLRDAEECLVLLGGLSKAKIPVVVDHCEAIDSKGKVYVMPNMLKPRYLTAVVGINNFIYVIGGSSNREEDHPNRYVSVTRTVQQYNPLRRQWFMIADMIKERVNHTATVVDDKIIVVGGQHRHEGEFASTVEHYCLKYDKWTWGSSMPIEVSEAASCTYEGKVYVSGGRNAPGRHSAEMHCYSVDRKIWERKASLRAPRMCHGMCAVASGVCVVGGITGGTRIVGNLEIRCNYSEIYNQSTNQWSTLTVSRNHKGLSDCSLAMWQGKMVVYGTARDGKTRPYVCQTEKQMWKELVLKPTDKNSLRAQFARIVAVQVPSVERIAL